MKKILLLAILSFALNTGALANLFDIEKKACDLDNGLGCANLGFMYDKGKGVKQSDFKAVEYWQKACDLDNGLGCAMLGAMYDKGKGVKQSNTQALEYSSKACDLKFQLGCKYYARLKKQ